MKNKIILSITILPILLLKADKYPFELPELEYNYNSLEPYIDEDTMKIHHNCHHKAYRDNLNKALQGGDEIHRNMSLEDLVTSNSIPKKYRAEVRNFGGGLINHNHYFGQFSPADISKKSPECELLKDINKYFGSFEKFKKKFNDQAKKIFGSGWVWLIRKPNGTLRIISKQNQDAPHKIGDPLVGMDLWEHAYYLKHNCNRAKHIDDFWQVLDWSKIEKKFDKVKNR